ncbi:hypothetical protein PR048_032829 [Dryococelus australis]|uniref:Uncharacterized protein n=1 Tax=Dryococelus australis TaxID=614101 RepID=A0ABQ9G6A5_9NEOP|nr:hypothetical protein PR048_032829 [Dryococelus australis]
MGVEIFGRLLTSGLLRADEWKVSGIVWHYSHMRKNSGSDPSANRTRFALVGAVAQWLAHPPPTTTIRARPPLGSLPDFIMWKSCWTMPLGGGIFSGYSRFFPPLHSSVAASGDDRHLRIPAGKPDSWQERGPPPHVVPARPLELEKGREVAECVGRRLRARRPNSPIHDGEDITCPIHCRLVIPVLLARLGTLHIRPLHAANRTVACILLSRLNFTVLYVLAPKSCLHWLLHKCEVTPFLSELHVIGAHYRVVFIYWCRATQGKTNKVRSNEKHLVKTPRFSVYSARTSLFIGWYSQFIQSQVAHDSVKRFLLASYWLKHVQGVANETRTSEQLNVTVKELWIRIRACNRAELNETERDTSLTFSGGRLAEAIELLRYKRLQKSGSIFSSSLCNRRSKRVAKILPVQMHLRWPPEWPTRLTMFTAPEGNILTFRSDVCLRRAFKNRYTVSAESLTEARCRRQDCTPLQCSARRGDERVDAHVSVAPSYPALLGLRRSKLLQPGRHLKVEVKQLPMDHCTRLYNAKNSLKSSTEAMEIVRKFVRKIGPSRNSTHARAVRIALSRWNECWNHIRSVAATPRESDCYDRLFEEVGSDNRLGGDRTPRSRFVRMQRFPTQLPRAFPRNAAFISVCRLRNTAGMKRQGKRETTEKIRRSVLMSGTILTCENPEMTRSGIEPGSPRWEAIRLTAQPPLYLLTVE